MWQIYAVLSLLFSSGENIIDKSAFVVDRRIDYAIASFWRIAIFVLLTVFVGLTGFFGAFSIVLSPLIALLGLSCALAALGYTYVLRRIEVTGIGAESYLAPFLFLIVDTLVLGTHLSFAQIAGIVIVTLGGFAFAIDGKSRRIKSEFSVSVWALILFDVAHTGIIAYFFKYLHVTQHLGGVSYIASTWLVGAVLLLALVMWQRKGRLLFQTSAIRYMPRMAVSKSFDSVSQILWTEALALAAVSQVSAVQALDPLVLFVMTILTQGMLRMRVGEKFGGGRLAWKAVSVGVLIFGGWLIG